MTGTVTAVEGRVSVLGVAKGARDAEGIEDACWPPEPVSAAGPVVRLALADGVSDSYRPGPWARDLVRAFGTRAPLRATTDPAEFAEVLRRQCAAWAPRLRGYVRDEREGATCRGGRSGSCGPVRRPPSSSSASAATGCGRRRHWATRASST